MREPSGEASTGTLAKAVLVMDHLAEVGHATARELADSLSEPRSSVYRLLGRLQAVGLVDAGPLRGSYRLGMRLLRYGSAVSAQLNERRVALPVMERLHHETHLTVVLVVSNGTSATVIERIHGEWVQPHARPVGALVPLHAGAAPRVLLAHQPRRVWSDYLREPLEPVYPQTPTSSVELVRELEQIRADGFCVSEEGFAPGTASVAAPIFDVAGNACAAVGMGGARAAVLDEGRADRSIARILAAAGEISAGLGYEPRLTPVRRPRARRDSHIPGQSVRNRLGSAL
jgi:DNA-binding IclR family transcriptional regulator